MNISQMTQLAHFDKQGASRMVDVSNKGITDRVAVAHAKITMKPETFQLIIDKKIQKGDVFEVARVAGIMAAKQTSSLIPMCHPLNLTSVKIDYANNSVDTIDVFSEVRVTETEWKWRLLPLRQSVQLRYTICVNPQIKEW